MMRIVRNPTAFAKDPHISRRKSRSKVIDSCQYEAYQPSHHQFDITGEQQERRRPLEHRNKFNIEFAGYMLLLNAVWSFLDRARDWVFLIFVSTVGVFLFLFSSSHF